MPCAFHQNGFWLPVCIAKVVGIFDHRVASMPRLAFEGLEPCEVKISCTVLRGLGAGDSPRLPGVAIQSGILRNMKEQKWNRFKNA